MVIRGYWARERGSCSEVDLLEYVSMWEKDWRKTEYVVPRRTVDYNSAL